jgi:hypothetical protein
MKPRAGTFEICGQPIPALRESKEMIFAFPFGHFHGQALIATCAIATILWVEHGNSSADFASNQLRRLNKVPWPHE